MKIFWSEFYESYMFLENDVMTIRTSDHLMQIPVSDFSKLEFICEVND